MCRYWDVGAHGGAEPGYEPADQDPGGHRQPRLFPPASVSSLSMSIGLISFKFDTLRYLLT
jgi:hypothetical protein